MALPHPQDGFLHLPEWRAKIEWRRHTLSLTLRWHTSLLLASHWFGSVTEWHLCEKGLWSIECVWAVTFLWQLRPLEKGAWIFSLSQGFFSFNPSNISPHSVLKTSGEVQCDSYPCFSTGKVINSSGFFQDFHCICDLQFQYDIPRCRFFGIFLLGVLWASWICALIPIINMGKFSAIITSNISSVPLSLSSSSISIMCILLLFVIFSQFLFSLQFGFYWHIFQLADSFLGCVQSSLQMSPSKAFFISFAVFFFISRSSFWFFLRVPISLLALRIC